MDCCSFVGGLAIATCGRCAARARVPGNQRRHRRCELASRAEPPNRRLRPATPASANSQRRGILLFGALRCGQGRVPGMLSAAGGFRLFGLCDAAILSMAFGGISRGGTEAWPGEVRDGSSHRYRRGYRPPAARCACAGKALRGRGVDRGSPRTVLGQS